MRNKGMFRARFLSGAALICLGCLHGGLLGIEAEKAKPASPSPKAAKPKPDSKFKIKKKPFVVQVNLKGVLEAEKMAEVTLDPQEWREWNVLQAVAPGAKVNKGDILVKCDPAKLDRTLADAEAGQALKKQTIDLARQELAFLKKTLPTGLADAERTAKRAAEDLALFEKIGRPWAVKWAAFSVKSNQDRLSYELEELKQLEKMYKEDELTEETEEIILKRQRDYVARLKFILNSALMQKDQTENVSLPRTAVDLKSGVEKVSLASERAQAMLPAALAQKSFELDLLAHKQKMEEGKLARLRADRALMEIAAPIAGVVYFGQCRLGRWPDVGEMQSSLRRGGALKPFRVAMTVVDSTSLFVRAEVPESALHLLKVGLEGDALPVGYPKVRAKAKVKHLDLTPVKDGVFEAQVAIGKGGAGGLALTAGMGCALSFIPYKKKDAIAVPEKSVFVDFFEGERQYVWVAFDKTGREKRWVKTGIKSKGEIEILEGLKDGEEIFLSDSPSKETASKSGDKKKG